MKKKSKFSKYEDQSTINMDSFDKRRFHSIYDNSKGMQELAKSYPGFDHLLGDMWGSLYKMKPILKEEVPDHLQQNHAIVERMMSDEDFEQHRIHTKLDELTSAIGTMKFGEETKKWIEQQEQENERMKELMQQLQDLKNNNPDGRQDQQIQETSAALNQELKDALNQPGNGFQQAMQRAMNDTNDLKDKVKSMIGGGSGNEEAELKKVPLREQLALAEALSKNDKLKIVAEWAGRMKAIARKKQKSKHSDSIDRSGVTIGNEIERLLPSELAQYANPITKLDFARRLTEAETLVYDQKGKETLGKGPIVLCLDQSGSMKNLDSQAKGFALALMWIAKRQKRDFCYIPFSSSSEQHIFEKGKISIRDMTRFATNFLGGGTNFQNPMNRALGVINQSRFEKADVIFITDGDDHVGEEFIETFNEKKKDKKFNVLSLVIGPERFHNYVKPFSDQIVGIEDFTDEKGFAAFEI